MRLDEAGCGWMWMDVDGCAFQYVPPSLTCEVDFKFPSKSGYFGLVSPHSVGMDDETGCLLTKRQL